MDLDLSRSIRTQKKKKTRPRSSHLDLTLGHERTYIGVEKKRQEQEAKWECILYVFTDKYSRKSRDVATLHPQLFFSADPLLEVF